MHRTDSERALRRPPGPIPPVRAMFASGSSGFVPIRAMFAAGRALCSAVALAVVLTPAMAGQVRVDVTSFSFTPSAINVNLGDQVVWVWIGGSHSATSGVSDGMSAGVPDGRFDSGTITTGANSAFSWKPTGLGDFPYYCTPHAAMGMIANIHVVASAAQVSSFRITEVRWSIAHDNDFVEVANLGLAAGNLGRYRLSVTGAAVQSVVARDILVNINGRVVFHFNQTGTNTATDLYIPGITLGPVGSAALYTPCTVAPANALTNDRLLADYVQWGNSGQQNEATANVAGAWSTGTFVPAVADGHSIEFCGTAAQHGVAQWQGSPTPTPGGTNCTTPAMTSTWGRVKALYR